MLLNRLIKPHDNGWKMARFCSVLASKYLNHRIEAAKLILNSSYYKLGDTITIDTNFSLQCYIIELLTTAMLPKTSSNHNSSFLSRLWPNGPEYIWKEIPMSPAASKSYVNYLNQVDVLMKKP